MELSRQSPSPTRYTGIGLVVALHLAGIYALSAGLITPLVKPKDPPIVLLPTPKTPEPQPTEPPKAPKPVIKDVFTPPVEPIPWTPANPTITPEPTRNEGPVAAVPDGPGATGNPPALTPPIVKAPPTVQGPGAVCSVMPRPEVPPMNWAGEAVLQVMATVRGGRVVGSEFRVMQGALDSKSRRALQRSVESALAGYQCQGDASFQQEFAFRVE